jgi:CBS domain-containing protein
MQLKDICTPDAAYCERKTTTLRAAEIMRQKHVGDLVVVVDDASDERTPVGIITDRDIVVKVLGNERDPSRVSAGDVMKTPVVVANHTDDVSDAIARMRAHRVRRLPVVGPHGRLIGIVTLDDLLRQLVNDAGALLEIVASEQDQEQRTLR